MVLSNACINVATMAQIVTITRFGEETALVCMAARAIFPGSPELRK
jgi:hypothetical protein